MAITNQDFHVTVNTLYGANCVTSFYYRKVGAHLAGDAATLAAGIDASITNIMAALMNSQANIGSIQVVNLVDMADYFAQESSETAGQIVSTSPGPRFTAYSFRLNRSRRDGRNGYKRFPGVAEELIAGESTNTSGVLTSAVSLMVSALGANIIASAREFVPMIPHRVLTTLPDGKKVYILTDLYNISSVEFRGLTTQNTRKA